MRWGERKGGGALVASLTVLLGVGSAFAEEIEPIDDDDAGDVADEIETQITAMRSDLTVVGRGYGAPLPAEIGRVERRLREGEIHFLLNDYLRASIVLLDVVEDEENKSHPRYDDCVFILAEALRKSKNYVGSRGYYEDLMPRASGERLKDVVLGLLEIAGATDHYEDVDRYVSRLRQAGALSRPDVDYIYGKMLFKGAGNDQSKVTRAYEVFGNIPAGTSVSPQAAYYAGVALVKLGRYEEALGQFKESITRLGSSKDQEQLRDLAHLSLGRLHQEVGDVSSSADAYQEISQTSPYFSEMLYEVAWAHVRSANQAKTPEGKQLGFKRALQATDLLMATSPGSRLFPQARILQGNLQIRMGAPESAYDTFQTIIDRYGGARIKLDAMLQEASDPKAFFDQLVAADLDRIGSASILPPLALSWALEEDSMGRAVAMQQDLADSRTFMSESQELIETLSAALSGEQKYRMVPGIGAARSKALSIENQVVNVNRRLLDLERRIVWPHAGASAQDLIDRAHDRARALEADVKGLPQTEEEMAETRGQIKSEFQATGRRAYRLTYKVASMAAQVVAVEVWLNHNRERLAPEELQLIEERLGAAREEIRALQDGMDVLRADIRKATTVSAGDGGGARASKLRAEFSDVMGEEIALLRSHRSGVPADYRGVLARLDQQRQSLLGIDQDLRQLQSVLDQQVSERVLEVRGAIATEVKNLQTYDVEHRDLKQQTDGLLGPVAAETLKSVGKQFRDLVLKADVGIIDVAWARKRAETEKVNDLIKEQQDRTQELEAEFADVLKDD